MHMLVHDVKVAVQIDPALPQSAPLMLLAACSQRPVLQCSFQSVFTYDFHDVSTAQPLLLDFVCRLLSFLLGKAHLQGWQSVTVVNTLDF